MWDIHYGIEKVWEMGYQRVVIETDCLKATSLINDAMEYEGPARNLVEMCRDARGRDWDLCFTYAPREQNKVINAMAKFASNQEEDLNWFAIPPIEIHRHIREDELGLLVFGKRVENEVNGK
ncbi:PREDICTED: uncharacterized protein LOC109185240 [Ipomoea nil]|uniref:uncharacterized protein LOC109185240 n=1 Tax=Ipomoea nil TaxID=35883 RepID=UPI000900DB4D|nr:PREDICTED: uncharacterized protein LOC109185240 [Ipomoea nil]